MNKHFISIPSLQTKWFLFLSHFPSQFLYNHLKRRHPVSHYLTFHFNLPPTLSIYSSLIFSLTKSEIITFAASFCNSSFNSSFSCKNRFHSHQLLKPMPCTEHECKRIEKFDYFCLNWHFMNGKIANMETFWAANLINVHSIATWNRNPNLDRRFRILHLLSIYSQNIKHAQRFTLP